MFRVRSSRLRITAAVAVAVSCLAATACGGTSAASRSVAPSASSAPDPLAGLSASKVIAEADADAQSAPSVTLDGTGIEQGQRALIDIGIKRGEGCTGSVDLGSKGGFKLIVIGKTVYLNPNKQFWQANAGANASAASAVIAIVNGRYLKLPASDKFVAGLADLCNWSKLIDDGSDTFTKGKVTTLDGRRVLPIKVSDGSTDYVTDTSKPEYLEGFSPKGTKGGSGKAIITVGAPVTLTAPPASQVIDGTVLGM